MKYVLNHALIFIFGIGLYSQNICRAERFHRGRFGKYSEQVAPFIFYYKKSNLSNVSFSNFISEKRALLKDDVNITRRFAKNSVKLQPSKSIDPWLGKDKLDHFLASAFIVGISYMFFRDERGLSDNQALVWSAEVSFSVGIAKEIRDKLSQQGMVSFKDLLWDLLGIGMGILIYS